MKNQSTSKWYEPIVDWFKLNGGKLLADLLVKIGPTYIKTLIGGLPGTIAVLLFKWIVIPFVRRFKSQLINDAEGSKYWKEFNEVLKKDDASHDEVTQGEDLFLNRPGKP